MGPHGLLASCVQYAPTLAAFALFIQHVRLLNGLSIGQGRIVSSKVFAIPGHALDVTFSHQYEARPNLNVSTHNDSVGSVLAENNS